MKKWLNNILYGYFHFNKQEVNGLFVLMVIVCIALAVRISMPYLLPASLDVEVAKIDWNRLAAIDSVNRLSQKRSAMGNTMQQNTASEPVKFVFDPNTVSAEEAIRLGFPERTAKTLVNFRSKGGKFRQPGDLKKLYGISEALYDELEPYILIAAPLPVFKKDSAHSAWPKKYPEKKAYHIELNSADSAAIVMLKGIGPALTKRILKYRSMLGGFYSTGQLREVYGMPDSTLQLIAANISVDPLLITKIQINKIEFNELRKHPYLTFQATQAIINYRSKHGALTPDNLKAIGALDPEKLQRLMPYLSFQ